MLTKNTKKPVFLTTLVITTLLIGLINASNCPNDCSNHGTCRKESSPNGRDIWKCHCSGDWSGDDCSYSLKTLRVGREISDSVSQFEWTYYTFLPASGSGYDLTIAQADDSQDVDIYVKTGQLPSKISFDIKDTSTNPTSVLNIPASTNTEAIYIGLYGFIGNPIRYTIKIEATNGCLNDCSNHGYCVRGQCLCNDGWAGEVCEIAINEITPGQTYRSITLEEDQWAYYKLEVFESNNMRVVLHQVQDDADIDFYSKKGKLPSQLDFDYADTSTNKDVTMDIVNPALGDWYFGFYAFYPGTFSFTVTLDSECPDKCSEHGECSGTFCSCSSEYMGLSCETRRNALNANEIVSGYVSENGWNYYRYVANSANNFIIEVNQTSEFDCDLYVQRDRNPTTIDYSLYDVSTDEVTHLRVDNPGTSQWYIGVYGFTPCRYTLRTFTSNSCPGNCNNHGVCSSSGRCICNPGYAGIDCKSRVQNLDQNVVLADTIASGNWTYYGYMIENPTSQLNIVVKEKTTSGFLWLYGSAGGFPTFTDYDESDTNSNTNTHRLSVEFAQPRRGITYYIGVYGSPFVMSDRMIDYEIVAWTPPFKK
eukprot:TRINITY_DN12139_c0_g1_i1.p1 TRINITY_DN12139_c0_g1~~TRINITY_DN12139_c0_g1_i1.p1  ORF type:complete len:592 (-),score=128.29 TRINITY_DN12139_c0_g1_i1:35-1810(-)